MLLFHNGIIHTMDAAQPTAEALLVGDDGRIAALGSPADLDRPGVRRVDLGGRALIPGFNDAHIHIWKLGLLLTVQVNARPAATPDIPSIIAAYHQRAEALPPGTWITGRGYHESLLPEGRHPTRHDLDRASAIHPIALTHTSGHGIVANSLALQLAGVTRDTPDPEGGEIIRDEQGEPLGLLQETAMGFINRAMPPVADDSMANAIRAALEHQLALGITSATDPLLAPHHLRVYRRLEAEGALRVRVNGLPVRREDGGTQIVPLPERYVSDTLRIDCVKFFADGGLSGATAAIEGTYKVTGTRGLLQWSDAELLDCMWEAHAAGFRIATHAIGDRTLEQVIGIYETLHWRGESARLPARRHRIEHFGLPTARHIERAAALGIIAVPQTVFLPALGAAFRRYVPDDLIPRCYPVRALIDGGVTVALSSDAPVVPDDNPLLGMKAALDRGDHVGEPLAPAQAITPYEALFAYTLGGAIASCDDGNRGSLRVGKWADLTILSGDPLATPAEALLDLRVHQTYVGGELRFEA